MTCADVASLLVRFIDGRLDEGDRIEVEHHLASCANCREAADEQRQVAAVLASREDAPVPAWFASRVAKAIDEQSGWFGMADWHWLGVRVAPAAAALFIAAAALVSSSPSTTTQKPDAGGTVSADTQSLPTLLERWAGGEAEGVPVTSVLWSEDVSDRELMTVLTAPPDATIAVQSNER